MDTEKEVIARNLMEVFYQFSRLNWIQNSPTGLRHSELIVLHCISRRTKEGAPGIKVSEISSILKVTSPTITQILNGLYTKGLIERCADKDDRRAVPVRLTEKGRIVVEESSESFLKSFTELIEYIGEKPAEELVCLLTRVVAYFERKKEKTVI